MVFLFLCPACENNDHEHCSKGYPAPPGQYGGSKCKCFVCADNIKAKCDKIDKTFNDMKLKFNKIIEK